MNTADLLRKYTAMGFSLAGLSYAVEIPEELLRSLCDNYDMNLASFAKEAGSEKLSHLSFLLGQIMLVNPEKDAHYLTDLIHTMQIMFDLSLSALAGYLGVSEDLLTESMQAKKDDLLVPYERKLIWLDGCFRRNPRLMRQVPPFAEKY